MTQLYGWGRYPRVDAQVAQPASPMQCRQALHSRGPVITRGLGRSYGDSSLAPQVLSTRRLDRFLCFDSQTGVLTCEGGATLDDILRTFVPRGWLPPVVPGTRQITVGGAIASDVHGKNHHVRGTFSAHVHGLELLLGNGERVHVSASDNADLFQATCGGMGLTGLILSASLQLDRIESSGIIQTTVAASSLDAVLEAFDAHANSTYSVAWIDGLARGAHLGRSVLMLGEIGTSGPLAAPDRPAKAIPFDMPSAVLNCTTARAFNALYFAAARIAPRQRRLPLDSFFFPLDGLSHWNRLYGAGGFVQYQCVLPRTTGAAGLREVLERISQSGQGAFLAVLKVFGAANANHLSFPVSGYTLALDFKAEPAVFELLDALDRIVLHHGGRLYLAKDARMSEATFKRSYPRWQDFEQVRARWHAHGCFASDQSRRLGLQ